LGFKDDRYVVMGTGRTIRLYLVEGAPTGIRIAEIINWTGTILAAPRSKLAEVIKRPEAQRTGVYLLVGDDPTTPHKQRLYVGEADDVADRLKAHNKDESKDFWDHLYLVTSKDANLTKAHARYLESQLITLAKLADRANVANSTAPLPKTLPEPDVVDMDAFLDHIQIVLPVLGLELLRPKGQVVAPKTAEGQQSGLELKLVSPKHEVEAFAVEIDGEVTVLAGSKATKHTFVSNTYADLRSDLIADGTLVEHSAELYRFSRSAVFDSLSAAAAVVLNRNSNGRIEWRLKSTNQTVKDWQEKGLQSV